METAKRPLVLIIEDEDLVAKFVRVSLETIFEMEIVGTLADGIKRLTRPPRIDAVLLDLCLPNGSGAQVIEAIASINHTLPIVVYTATDIDSVVAIKAGAQDVLRKPFASPDDIRGKLIRAIARLQAAKEVLIVDVTSKQAVDAAYELGVITDVPKPGSWEKDAKKTDDKIPVQEEKP